MEKKSIKKEQWKMAWDGLERHQDTLPRGLGKHQPCPGTSFLDQCYWDVCTL